MKVQKYRIRNNIIGGSIYGICDLIGVDISAVFTYNGHRLTAQGSRAVAIVDLALFR